MATGAKINGSILLKENCLFRSCLCVFTCWRWPLWDGKWYSISWSVRKTDINPSVGCLLVCSHIQSVSETLGESDSQSVVLEIGDLIWSVITPVSQLVSRINNQRVSTEVSRLEWLSEKKKRSVNWGYENTRNDQPPRISKILDKFSLWTP